MKRRETPPAWRRGFALYRRRTGRDALGNETAFYSMEAPDETVSAPDGVDFQHAKSWNTSGRLGSAGAGVEEIGEVPGGGVLEGYLKSALAVSPFDRLEIDGALYEVRSVQRWPGHRKLLLQRVK